MRSIARFSTSFFIMVAALSAGCVAGANDEEAALSEDSLVTHPPAAAASGSALDLPAPRNPVEPSAPAAQLGAKAAGSCSWTTFMTWPTYDPSGTARSGYAPPTKKLDAQGTYYEVSHATLARKNFGSLIFGLAINGYPANRDVYVTLAPVGAPQPRKMALFTYWVTDFSAASGLWNGLHLVSTWGPRFGVYADQLQNGMFRVDAQVAGAKICTGGFRIKLVP